MLLLFIKIILSNIVPILSIEIFLLDFLGGRAPIMYIGTLDLNESVLPRIPCFVEKLCLAKQIWAFVVESDPFIPLLP